MAEFNEQGQQIPDQTPIEVPVGFGVPTDLTEIIRQLVRVESERQKQEGGETFEESDDFDTGEDELVTPYQMHPMQEEAPHEAKFIKDEKTPSQPASASPGANDADYQAFLAWKQAKAAAEPQKNSTSEPLTRSA